MLILNKSVFSRNRIHKHYIQCEKVRNIIQNMYLVIKHSKKFDRMISFHFIVIKTNNVISNSVIIRQVRSRITFGLFEQ